MELTNFEYDCRFRDDHFRALCDLLRRNDPNVNTGCVYFGCCTFAGFGDQIQIPDDSFCSDFCDALLLNTVVTKIGISVRNLTSITHDSDEDETCQSTLKKLWHIVASSATLTTVSLMDGGVERDESTDSFCIALLSELARNPNITALQSSQLIPPTPLASFCLFNPDRDASHAGNPCCEF
jgi:hypothetical protein